MAEDDSVANKNSLHYELRLQRVLVQNSLAVYATWTTIASLLNVNAAFQYFGPYDAETTSATLCALLLFIVIGWFILENTVFYAETRYVFTIYPGECFDPRLTLRQTMKNLIMRVNYSIPQSCFVTIVIVNS